MTNGHESALKQIHVGLVTNERALRAMLDPDTGPIEAHFDEYQATTLRCVINGILNLSLEVRGLADLLAQQAGGYEGLTARGIVDSE